MLEILLRPLPQKSIIVFLAAASRLTLTHQNQFNSIEKLPDKNYIGIAQARKIKTMNMFLINQQNSQKHHQYFLPHNQMYRQNQATELITALIQKNENLVQR